MLAFWQDPPRAAASTGFKVLERPLWSRPRSNAAQGPSVLVLPEGDAASRVASDIRFFLGEEEGDPRPLQEQVVLYPSSELTPFAFGGFEADVWIGRMAALFRLTEGKPPRVIVTGLDSVIRKIVPRSVFARTSFSLSVGQELNREALLERLVAAGYTRSPLVEDAGEFSVPRLYH